MIDEYAYFKVTGSGDCDVVTKIMKRKPNKSWSEGDPRPKGNSVYPFMFWALDSGLEKTVPVEQHIEELFLYLNSNALAIRNLAPDYECIIQCVGTFGSSHGFHFRPDQVRKAAHMGIGLSMDFYATKELENDS